MSTTTTTTSNTDEQKNETHVPLPSIDFPLEVSESTKRDHAEEVKQARKKRRKVARVVPYNINTKDEFYLIHPPDGTVQHVTTVQDQTKKNHLLARFPDIRPPTRGIKLVQLDPKLCASDTSVFLIHHNLDNGGRREIVVCEKQNPPQSLDSPLPLISFQNDS